MVAVAHAAKLREPSQLLAFPEGADDERAPSRHVRIGETVITLALKSHRRVHIISLRTATRKLGKGFARHAMEALCLEADEADIELDLWASPLTKRTKPARLIRFYESLGFQHTGKIVNQAGEPEMLRRPQRPAIS